MTRNQLYTTLGLLPPGEYVRQTLTSPLWQEMVSHLSREELIYRRTGKTTSKLVEALYETLQGERVAFVVQYREADKYVTEEFVRYLNFFEDRVSLSRTSVVSIDDDGSVRITRPFCSSQVVFKAVMVENPLDPACWDGVLAGFEHTVLIVDLD